MWQECSIQGATGRAPDVRPVTFCNIAGHRGDISTPVRLVHRARAMQAARWAAGWHVTQGRGVVQRRQMY